MPRRFYSNAALPTTLTTAITVGQTSFDVNSVTGFPTSFPFTLVIDKSVSGKAEVVDVVAVSGLTLTVVRGQDGTPAVAHDAGAAVTHDHTARDYADTETRLDALEGSVDFTKAFLFGVS